MTIENLSVLTEFLDRNKDKIDYVKVTGITKIGFNSMEGSQYKVNFKIETVDGYRNKLLKWFTNSTYLDEYYDKSSEGDYLSVVKEMLEISLAI